ncbi:helix-turn-helix transcriptional regulator [Adlercreutzia muris]|uniref:helix-turn-helix transcriptional regulator n=1 Tax=Adlercreutzia muris TaxID=1796610 RepID=UPI0035127C40
MGSEHQKLKLLYLMQMLYEQTDEAHGLTTPELIEGLAERGVDAERKSIYRDLETLRSFGLAIEKLPTRPVSYALASRTFSAAELMLLVDAVQSSRFLTRRMANRLVGGIASLGSCHQEQALSRNVHVEGRITMQNESVFHHVSTIHEALRQRRQVAFRYVKHDVHKRPVAQKDGRLYRETPVRLIYSEGCYYLIAYNEKHESFPAYRVDRMQGLRLTDTPAVRNTAIATFDADAYSARTFSMFGGATRRVTLLVEEPVMSAMLDRFGKDVESAAIDERWARVYVTVTPSPVFFGWLAQFGRGVRIEAPSDLATEYAAYLRDILEDYA